MRVVKEQAVRKSSTLHVRCRRSRKGPSPDTSELYLVCLLRVPRRRRFFTLSRADVVAFQKILIFL
jgi:hypothetical protein